MASLINCDFRECTEVCVNGIILPLEGETTNANIR